MNEESDLDALIAKVKPTPGVSAGNAMTQQALDRLDMHLETALLSLPEIAEYLGESEEWVAQQVSQRLMIDAEHAGDVVYPAFQVDPENRVIRNWVPLIATELDDFGISGQSFILWSSVESSFFDGELPALCAGDEDFFTRALADLTSVS